MILGEVKARPKDIISFSLDYISKSKVQTSNPSSSPIPLDTPARPADSFYILIYTYDRFKEAQVRSAWLQEDSDEHPAVPEPEVRMPLEILVRRNRVEDSVTSLEQEKRFRGKYNCQLCPDKILINQKHMEVLKQKLLVSLMRCCLPVTALHLCEVSVPLAVAPGKRGAQAQRETF